MFNVGVIAGRRAVPNVFFDIVPLVPSVYNPDADRLETSIRLYANGPHGAVYNATNSGFGESGRFTPPIQARAVLEAGYVNFNELSNWKLINSSGVGQSVMSVGADPFFRVRIEARDPTTLAPLGSTRFWTANAAP